MHSAAAGLSNVNINAPITREVLAQSLYNTLLAKPIFVSPSVGTTLSEAVWEHTLGDDTLLRQRFGLTDFPAGPEES